MINYKMRNALNQKHRGRIYSLASTKQAIITAIAASIFASCGEIPITYSRHQPSQSIAINLYPYPTDDSLQAEFTYYYNGENVPQLDLDDMIVIHGKTTDTVWNIWKNVILAPIDGALVFDYISNNRLISSRTIHIPSPEPGLAVINSDTGTFHVPPLNRIYDKAAISIALKLFSSPGETQAFKRFDYNYDTMINPLEWFEGRDFKLYKEFSDSAISASDSALCTTEIFADIRVNEGVDFLVQNSPGNYYTHVSWFDITHHRKYNSISKMRLR